MNIFLCYGQTGEDPKELRSDLRQVIHILYERKHDVFCSLFKSTLYRTLGLDTYEKRLEYCLQIMSEYDQLLVITRSSNESNGVKKEVEEAKKLGKEIVVAQGVGFRRPPFLAHERSFFYSNIENLVAQIKSLY